MVFIGAHKDVTEDEIVRGFAAFYGSYYSLLDISAGIQSLHNEMNEIALDKKTFWRFSAEDVFDMTLNPDRDPKHFAKMVKEQLYKHIIKGDNYTWAEVEFRLRQCLKELSKKYRDKYCFKDIYGSKR